MGGDFCCAALLGLLGWMRGGWDWVGGVVMGNGGWSNRCFGDKTKDAVGWGIQVWCCRGRGAVVSELYAGGRWYLSTGVDRQRCTTPASMGSDTAALMRAVATAACSVLLAAARSGGWTW